MKIYFSDDLSVAMFHCGNIRRRTAKECPQNAVRWNGEILGDEDVVYIPSHHQKGWWEKYEVFWEDASWQ